MPQTQRFAGRWSFPIYTFSDLHKDDIESSKDHARRVAMELARKYMRSQEYNKFLLSFEERIVAEGHFNHFEHIITIEIYEVE